MNEQIKYDPQGKPISRRNIPLGCPKCGTSRIACDINVYAGITISPCNKGFLDFRRSGLAAAACPNCGYTEFYATQPTELLPKRTI
jgi:predicted nucleic-acid-binding Zn-ribbon protein